VFIHVFLVYVGHFLNTIVFFGPFWRLLWLSAIGSHLVRLMVAPALSVLACQYVTTAWPESMRQSSQNFPQCVPVLSASQSAKFHGTVSGYSKEFSSFLVWRSFVMFYLSVGEKGWKLPLLGSVTEQHPKLSMQRNHTQEMI